MREGEGIAVEGRIPEDLELFQDHFPAFPVLPGVLSLELLKLGALTYLRRIRGQDRSFRMRKIDSVKFSRFLKPGDLWEGELKLLSMAETESCWQAILKQGGEKAVTARFVLEEEN